MEDIVRVPLPNNREDLLIYTFIKMNTGGTHAYMKSILLNRMLVARAAAARLLFGRWTMHSYWCWLAAVIHQFLLFLKWANLFSSSTHEQLSGWTVRTYIPHDLPSILFKLLLLCSDSILCQALPLRTLSIRRKYSQHTAAVTRGFRVEIKILLEIRVSKEPSKLLIPLRLLYVKVLIGYAGVTIWYYGLSYLNAPTPSWCQSCR
jgi:hypothetical protein